MNAEDRMDKHTMPLRPQQLGPKQIAWLEERFQYFGVYRKQAEAPTGVAVIVPPHSEAG